MGPVRALKDDVKRKGMMRLKYEAAALSESIKDPVAYAMERYAYYVCFKCQRVSGNFRFFLLDGLQNLCPKSL